MPEIHNDRQMGIKLRVEKYQNVRFVEVSEVEIFGIDCICEHSHTQSIQLINWLHMLTRRAAEHNCSAVSSMHLSSSVLHREIQQRSRLQAVQVTLHGFCKFNSSVNVGKENVKANALYVAC